MNNHTGEIIINISVCPSKERLFLHTNKGKHVYYADGDCCSSSWIEHIDDPISFIDAEIIKIIEMEDPNISEIGGGFIKYYQTCIKTTKGDFHIEYRNSSNGYYGGYLQYAGTE